MTDTSLTSTQKRQLKRYPRVARRLPPHPETFGYYDIDLQQPALMAFSRADLIRSRGTIVPEAHPGGRKRATKWQTAPGVAGFVAANIDPRTWTPCGHSTGVRCVRTGTVYTCTDDDCDTRFSRRVAEAVVNDDPLPAADREVIEA